MLASALIISCSPAPSATPMPTLTKAETLLKMARAGANLKDADLSGADLVWANLSGADLLGANLDNAIGADLTGTRNVPDKYLGDCGKC